MRFRNSSNVDPMKDCGTVARMRPVGFVMLRVWRVSSSFSRTKKAISSGLASARTRRQFLSSWTAAGSSTGQYRFSACEMICNCSLSESSPLDEAGVIGCSNSPIDEGRPGRRLFGGAGRIDVSSPGVETYAGDETSSSPLGVQNMTPLLRSTYSRPAARRRSSICLYE